MFEKDITDDKSIDKIIDEKINEVLSKQEYTESEKYFTKSLKKELIKDIEIIRQQHQHIGFDNYKYEKNVDVSITEDISFKGVIDKLIHKKIDDERMIAVVDYKTGSEEYREEMVEKGLSLQLPSYLYLASKLFEEENKKYAGFYIQQLINTDTKYEVNKPIAVKKFNSMKFKGKVMSDEDYRILEHLIKTFRESELINIYSFKRR
ncbi:MAG: PD-(D/E)XK nuclease family protein [Erysipelotrichaceae bacterium]